MSRRSLATSALALFSLCFASSARASDDQYAGPAKYEHKGIAITANKLYIDDDRLVFKLTVWNKTDKKIVVDRDAMSCKTSMGKSVEKRYKGMMTGFGMTDSKHEIAGGDNHELWVEFVVGAAPPAANLLFKTSVVSDGKTIDLPDYLVTQQKKK